MNTYKLSEIPKGVDCDEAGMGYDAYCIANYGVDRYLNKFPIYFTNFGDGQSLLYAYLAALSIKVLGFSTFSIRIPALLLSVLEVVIAYFLVKEFKGKKMGLLFMLLVTISPWHIMKSRWGLDAFLLSPLLTFSMYALLKAVNSQSKRKLKFLIAGLLFGLTLYTYAISYVIVPIFLLITGIYLVRRKKLKMIDILIFIIPLAILAIPLILMLMVQKGWINEIHSFITIQKLQKYRESDIKISNILENIKSIRCAFLVDKLPFNSIEGFGNFYYFGTPLIVIGFFIAIYKSVFNRKSKNIELDTIMLFMFLANLVWGFLIEVNTNRLNGLLISATYFILITLQEIYKFRKEIFGIIGITYLIAFIMFNYTYFNEFKNCDIKLFAPDFIELVKYLDKFESKDIYINTKTHEAWIYELYAEQENPYEVHSQYRYFTDGKVFEYGKYHNNNILTKYDDNAIYVFSDSSREKELLDMGFKKEMFKNKFAIMYK